jgi:hypothetical protein
MQILDQKPELVDNIWTMKVVTCISDPTQIGYTHGLKASCEYWGLELVTLCSQNWQSHRQKDTILKSYLQNLDKDELIFFTDGYDTIFLNNQEEILSKYYKITKGNSILISGDRICSPDHNQSPKFPKSKYGYDYINCGGVIANAGDYLKIIQELENISSKDKSPENKEYKWSNQYLWTKLYLSKKFEITIDHNCEIFQTFTTEESIKNLFDYVNNEPELSFDEDLYKRKSLVKTITIILEEVDVAIDGRVFNKTTKNYPVQIHFNTKINKLVMFMHPFVKLIEKVNQ